ncbi:tRNA-specific 2-thiouridylase [Chlorella sorokiniana]|uniref:tRNA-5-taurinomethyluridine 2-sulfurtransferase n=1 Tax=Chlorella sorokiniana TaxID=3076 RepID=A0A2P6TDL8_CHLSO|nr:tRNA-specific 2-thiouridylase [Chlorella sorokiniana]|eukprot:PRW20746.1 tRNA-specific 2-thiouridylase [Chlorella sorokiniana]
MAALQALAAPRPLAALPAQQFVSLRSFCPPARPQARRRRSCHPPPAAAAAEELLLGARPLVLPTVPIPEADQLPPFQEWHRHPELLTGCEPDAAPLQVAVLLSGGVDSSLALHLLKAAGHHVTAFYLQIWFQEDFRNFWDACPWEEDLAYCQAVCKRLGVELRMVPLTDQYWDRVVAHCISEIRQGRTPNPDVLCNSRVKFGAFYEYLEKEHGAAFDRVASGHYARLERGPVAGIAAAPAGAAGQAGEAAAQLPPLAQQQQQCEEQQQDVRLALTPDAVKDQTYFLAHLSQRQLARTLFPLGHLTKPQVRALAEAADLPNKARKDSQGICFLGKVKFSEFVREHLGEWPGPIVEEESDEVVGYHRGFWFHTVGQRKGIPLSGGPWYVTRKDPHHNAVYVSRQYHEHAHRRDAFTCGPISWCSAARPDPALPLFCKVRHGPHMYGCQLEASSDGSSELRVTLDGNDQGLAAGQFAVFYQAGVCLGSAVITGCDAY